MNNVAFSDFQGKPYTFAACSSSSCLLAVSCDSCDDQSESNATFLIAQNFGTCQMLLLKLAKRSMRGSTCRQDARRRLRQVCSLLFLVEEWWPDSLPDGTPAKDWSAGTACQDGGGPLCIVTWPVLL
jgi:hypothetical protein